MVTHAADGDFDEDGCACQDFVPEDKRIDFIGRVFDEKTGKWKRKVVLRYHKDCGIHGVVVKDAARTEPATV